MKTALDLLRKEYQFTEYYDELLPLYHKLPEIREFWELNYLWLRFSQEYYASMMAVNDETIEDFLFWLKQ